MTPVLLCPNLPPQGLISYGSLDVPISRNDFTLIRKLCAQVQHMLSVFQNGSGGYLDNLQLSRTFSFTFPWGKGLSDFSTLAFLLHNVCLPANIWFCFFSSQVEHFLGIKRKPETGFSGAPKKPKIWKSSRNFQLAYIHIRAQKASWKIASTLFSLTPKGQGFWKGYFSICFGGTVYKIFKNDETDCLISCEDECWMLDGESEWRFSNSFTYMIIMLR